MPQSKDIKYKDFAGKCFTLKATCKIVYKINENIFLSDVVYTHTHAHTHIYTQWITTQP